MESQQVTEVVQLVAEEVAFPDERSDVAIFGLAEHVGGPGWALVFQRAGQPTDQDRALGIDGYSLSSHAGASAYDCATHWTVSNGSLDLTLQIQAARNLDLPARMMIELPPGTSEDQVSEVMAAIVDGTGRHA
jgi:hypothetical protein